jgi:hypothetical protein
MNEPKEKPGAMFDSPAIGGYVAEWLFTQSSALSSSRFFPQT